MPYDLPILEFAFPGPLRDKIVAAIETGTKTATSSLLREYEVAREAAPYVGYKGILVDSDGKQRFVLETTKVDVVALSQVSLAHALAEGEGYTSVEEWRVGHLRFWGSKEMRAELGSHFTVTDSTKVVLEQFKIVR